MNTGTAERTQSKQEQEEVVISFLHALKSHITEETPIPELPILFSSLCEALYERAQQPNTRWEEIEKLITTFRKHKKYKAFDDMLKRRYDSPPKQEEGKQEETHQDGMLEYTPLSAGIIPKLKIEHTGVVALMDAYISYSKELSPEGYEDFHELCFWGLLSIIAARRIAIAFSGKIYTSLYLAMVAKGAAFSKTETVNVTRRVLDTLWLSYMLMPDRQTPQSMLSNMAGKHIDTSRYDELASEAAKETFRKKIASCGQRGWINDELGKFFTGMTNHSSVMAEFNSILLSLESAPSRYTNDTITRGSEPIEKPYVSIIGCATPSNFRDNNHKGTDLWRDGTYHRYGVICPPSDAYLDIPFKPGATSVPTQLITKLSAWNERLGEKKIALQPILDKKYEPTGEYEIVVEQELPEQEITFTDDAYTLWTRYRSEIRAFARNDTSEIFDGAYKRLAIRAVKLAALAASVEESPGIELRHMVIALQFTEKMRESFHRLYAQVFEPLAKESPEDKILKLLRQKGPLTAREISQHTNIDSLTVHKRLDVQYKEGELILIEQGRKKLYAINNEREKSQV